LKDWRKKMGDHPLAGKFALITGGSRGIGRGIAIRLAERGAAVAVNYRQDKAAAEATVDHIKGLGGDAFSVQADVSRPDELREMIVNVHKSFGALDIFINNALGDMLAVLNPPTTATLDQWESAYQSQARAFMVGAQAAAALLRDGGRIFAVSYWPGSHGGGFQGYFSMGANKAAMESMCRYLAVALAPRRITANAICAGITNDSILNKLPGPAQEAMLEWLRSGWNPAGRAGTPADIGGAIAALSSDDAAWITGQTIVADGGASLMNPEVPLFLQKI
jgi:enoyl-[acyl-carrier protein] reductase III